MPDAGLAFQIKVFTSFPVFASSLGSGKKHRNMDK
jgi:hypothetical protein